MEEKEKWTVPTENAEEKPKNLEEKEEKAREKKLPTMLYRACRMKFRAR